MTSPTASQQRWKKLLIAAPFVVGIALFFLLGGGRYLQLDAIQQQRLWLQEQTAAHFWLVYLGVGALYVLVTALSIPGATVLSLLCGFLFGRWFGTGLIVVAATSGAVLVFLAARYLFAQSAGQRMAANAATARMLKGINTNAFHYLLFLRLVPAFPFWLVNLVPAFTSIGIGTYASATAIGIVPAAFVIANLGGSFGEIDNLAGLLSPTLLLALALLGLLALIPIVAQRWNRPAANPKDNME